MNALENGISYMMTIFTFFKTFTDVLLLISSNSSPDLDQKWKTRGLTANARVTVDIDLSFNGKSSQISHDQTHRENLVGFIFSEFNCNYLNRTRRIFVEIVFWK